MVVVHLHITHFIIPNLYLLQAQPVKVSPYPFKTITIHGYSYGGLFNDATSQRVSYKILLKVQKTAVVFHTIISELI